MQYLALTLPQMKKYTQVHLGFFDSWLKVYSYSKVRNPLDLLSTSLSPDPVSG